MSVNLVSAPMAAVNNAPAGDGLTVMVLKKAIDMQAQGAAQLIQSLPTPPTAAKNPPHLGNHLNVMA